MKWFAILFAIGIAFFYGLHVGNQRKPETPGDDGGLKGEFARLSRAELQDYLNLQDQRLKYERADEILAKIMQVFLADLGLHASSDSLCKLNATEYSRPKKAMAAEVVPPAEADKPAPKKADFAHYVISPDKSRGAVHALYQAILWRNPDLKGETVAVDRFSSEGWNAYIHNGKAMLQGPEFLKHVEPSHTPQQIINHMYAVYMGRCAFPTELKAQMDSLGGEGPSGIISSVISTARQMNADQIFAGGFSPNSCEATP